MRSTSLAIICPLCALLAACDTPARVIETGGTESITSVGEVDIQDLKNAASGMLESLISIGVLDRAPNQPARLSLDRITNDTSSSFSTDELIYRMREQLVNSGKAQVITAAGDNPESRLAQDELRRKAMQEGRATIETLTPDYTLTGRITQLKRDAGRMRQTTYTFRLTLTDVRTGLEVWTKNEEVTKQGTKDGIGF